MLRDLSSTTYVSHIDGDATVFLFGGIVNLIVVSEFCQLLVCQHLGDGCRQGGLAVVDMPNGPNVAVGLVTLKNLFLGKPQTKRESQIAISKYIFSV